METGNPHQTAHWKRWLFAIWVLMCCALIAFRWQNIHFLILADTDYDLRQYRLDPPRGADIHWSRLVDLPLAGIMLALKLFIGWLDAERAAIAVAPLLPFGVATLGITLAARRLVAQGAWAFAVALLICAPATMNMFMPTRIDHHGWQLAFLALTLAGLVDDRRVRGGIIVGLATAASLAIGLEMLPYLAICGAAAALRWIIDREDAALVRAYGAALAAGTGMAYLVFASYANRVPRCDALSPVWLSVMVIAGFLALTASLRTCSAEFSEPEVHHDMTSSASVVGSPSIG